MMKITEPDDKLNCKLGLNGKTARTKTLLSYTSSLKDTKDLLTEHGFAGVSEKSFKASGVSALLDKKTSLSYVQVYGRWKAPQTVLHYYDSSVSRRKEISNVLLTK